MLRWLLISRSGSNGGPPLGRKGFTLLEILISISIAATIGVLISQVFFTTTRSNTKTEILKEVKQNGDYALNIMERMIRNAIRVESTCAESGSTLSSLAILNPDGDTTTFGCTYSTTYSVTLIASTSASAGTEYLTSTGVTLGGTSCSDANNSLSFVCTSYSDQPPKVSVSFTVRQPGVPPDQSDQASMLFKTTATPRNK